MEGSETGRKVEKGRVGGREVGRWNGVAQMAQSLKTKS